MTTSAASSTSAAFLARLLHGLDMTSINLDHPDFTADEVQVDGAKVSMRLFAPTNDAYRVTVEWLSGDSP